MATKYDIQTVTTTHNRLAGSSLSLDEMKTELEAPPWLPMVGQMIVLSDSDDIKNSKRYGIFIKMQGSKYVTTAGTLKYARPMTADEIAACY